MSCMDLAEALRRLVERGPWTWERTCHFCGEESMAGLDDAHDDDCPWVAARRALGMEENPADGLTPRRNL